MSEGRFDRMSLYLREGCPRRDVVELVTGVLGFVDQGLTLAGVANPYSKQSAKFFFKKYGTSIGPGSW